MQLSRMDEIRLIIKGGANAAMTLPEIIREEISEFRASEQYKIITEAERYYRNRSDVQRKTNRFKNRSNTKIEHPILKKLVDQKANYLLSKAFTIESESETYAAALNNYFDLPIREKIKSLGKGAVKSGIAWLAPYFDPKTSTLKWMRLPSDEVIPEWRDAEHTELDAYIRVYNQVVYEGKEKKVIEKIEWWDVNGVKKFYADGNGETPKPDYDPETGQYEFPHFFLGDKGQNWETVPIVWLKYNEEELPLQYFIKDLIDDVNWQTSVTSDVLRDVAKFVFALRGYGGQDLAEFVMDLQESLAIKLDADGGVDKLEPTINIDAVMAFLDKNRRDLYDYANSVDTKDPDLGNASGTSINFRYMDLDTDCAALGAELKGALARMKLFIDAAFAIAGKGDFSEESFEITFNADMPVNETDIIANVVASEGTVSKRTQLANHPWVVDVDAELKELKKEKEEALAEFGEGLFDATMGANGQSQTGQNGGVNDGSAGQ